GLLPALEDNERPALAVAGRRRALSVAQDAFDHLAWQRAVVEAAYHSPFADNLLKVHAHSARPVRVAYTTASARLRNLVFEQPHQLGFRQRIEVELEADHGGRSFGIDGQLLDADGEHGEQVAV